MCVIEYEDSVKNMQISGRTPTPTTAAAAAQTRIRILPCRFQ